MFVMYRPLLVFVFIGLGFVLIGMIPLVRLLIFYLAGYGAGHVQSLVLGGARILIACFTFLIALVADLINFNRRLLEIILEKTRRMEFMIEDDGETALSSSGKKYLHKARSLNIQE